MEVNNLFKEAPKKPSKKFLVIGSLSLICSILFFVFMIGNIVGLFTNSTDVTIPYNDSIQFDKQGRYYIYLQTNHSSNVYDKINDKNSGLDVNIYNDDTQIQIRDMSMSANMNMNGKYYVGILEFDINKAGEYKLETKMKSGEQISASLRIKKGLTGSQMLYSIFALVIIMFIGIASFVICIIIYFSRRLKFKNYDSLNQNIPYL